MYESTSNQFPNMDWHNVSLLKECWLLFTCDRNENRAKHLMQQLGYKDAHILWDAHLKFLVELNKSDEDRLDSSLQVELACLAADAKAVLRDLGYKLKPMYGYSITEG